MKITNRLHRRVRAIRKSNVRNKIPDISFGVRSRSSWMTMIVLPGAFLLFCHSVKLPTAVAAPSEIEVVDEADRGRLPDGRAFRTDSEGNQLVDYLAELEVNIDTLGRQVKGLQEELQEKSIAFENCRKGSPGLLEKDLRSSHGAAPNASAAAAQVVSQQCEEDLRRVSALLEGVKSDFEIERQLAAQKESVFNVRLEKLSQESSEKSARLLELSNRLQEIETDAKRKEEQLISSRALEAELLKQSNKLKADLDSRQDKSIATPPDLRVAGPEARASFSDSRDRALQVVRSKMSTELNQLRGLLETRDQLYKKFTSRRSDIGFRPTKPVSSRGYNIVNIQSMLAQSSTFGELSALKKDISEISDKLNDDLALLRRIERARG